MIEHDQHQAMDLNHVAEIVKILEVHQNLRTHIKVMTLKSSQYETRLYYRLQEANSL